MNQLKNFIKKVILFACTIYGVLLIIDIIITKTIISKAVGYDAEIPEMYKGAIKTDLLIIGTSRAKQHYFSDIIEDSLNIRVYNIGLGAVRFDIVNLLFSKYINKGNQKPKYITLNIECGMLVPINSFYRPWRLHPFLLYDLNMLKYTHKYQGFNIYYYFIPLTRYSTYFDEINNYYFKVDKMLYNGSMPYNDTITCKSINTEEFNAEKIKYSKTRIEYIFDTVMVNSLQNLADYCNKNGIHLNLVYSPEYHYGQSFVSNRDSIVTFYKQFCDKNGIEFKDFSQEDICYDSSLFYNVLHLNQCGAQLFTQKYYIPYMKEYIKKYN